MASPDTIQISGLQRGELTALRKLAKAEGMSIENYARQMIEDGLALERVARTSSFDELFAPVQRRFAQSRMTEEQLDGIVSAARSRHHRRTTRKSA